METGEFEQSADEIIASEWEQVVLPRIAEEQHEAAEFFLEITLAQYSEEGRYYHTLTHIADGIKKLEAYRDRKDYAELFLAFLWHDLIYDPRSKTNEEDSAREAVDMMHALGLNGAAVSRLIMATKSHQAELEDEAVICGIDMSIVAADENTYDAYKNNVYREYGVTDKMPELFRKGREAFLRGMIQEGKTGNLFTHPDFAHLNEPAVRNMERELAALAA